MIIINFIKYAITPKVLQQKEKNPYGIVLKAYNLVRSHNIPCKPSNLDGMVSSLFAHIHVY